MADPSDIDERLASSSHPLDVSAVRRAIGPGIVLGDRFEIQYKLGEGGMGQVFAAFDREKEARVALKLLGQLTPQSITQIKREFRTAAELVHPNLVRLYELFCDGIEWFFTMELVEGFTLSRLFAERGGAGPDLVRHVFQELARALMELHRAGTLHGDLKPSNFLVTGDVHRVVLMDFGLARPIGPTLNPEFAGTPAYMAPEQALGHDLTEAADWYAFGVVLYEVLTGELPLRRPSLSLLSRAPADLRELCIDLLRLRPQDRPSGNEVLARIGTSSAAHRFSTAPPPSRRALIGRKAELSALNTAFDRMRGGTPSIVLVHGPSGIGKTALVERFVRRVRSAGAIVLSGRCRERESMSFKAVDGLIDDIVTFVDDLRGDEAAAVVPQNIGDLTVLFPALRGPAAIAEAPQRPYETPDHAVVRRRAVGAFAELLERLRNRAPLVVWIDDLQWSDAESALLLGRVLGGSHKVPLLFIGSHRSDGGERAPLLDAILGDPTLELSTPIDIALGPLGQGDAERLALELLPPETPSAGQIAHNIGRDAGGHPLFIAELAHSAVSTDQDGGEPPSTLSELVSRRVASLPGRARTCLAVTAVAGAPLSRIVLRRAQGADAAEIEQALDLLRANRLAKSQGLKESDAIDIHHDRIREIVIQGLSDEERRGHHLTLARVLEARPDSNPEGLAAHYQAAGDLARAGRRWIDGADQAFRALAFAHAAELYERGMRLADLDAEELRAVRIRFGDALAYAGRGPAAAEVYLTAAATSAHEEALELRRRAAEQLLLSGHIERGLAVIDQVLAATRMRTTHGHREAMASIVLCRLLLRLRGFRWRVRAESELSSAMLARVDASWTIACSLGAVDFVRGAAFQNRHLLLALRAGEPRRLLRALTAEVSYAAAPGAQSERRTSELLSMADELARGRSDPASIGLVCLSRGIVEYLQENLASALARCEEALRIFTTRCTGAIWETVTARRFVIASLFFLGRFRRLAELVPPLLAECEDTGNIYATMCFRTAYSWPAWLVHDDVAGARKQLERARSEWKSTGFQLSHCNLLIGEVHVDLYEGDGARAVARMHDDWEKIVASQLFRIAILRAQLWQLRAAAALVHGQYLRSRGQNAAARALFREAREAARELRGGRSRRAAPLAGMIEAALDVADGNEGVGKSRIEQSIREFDRQGLRLFSAAARVRLGELATGDERAELTEDGYAEFRGEGIANPARMVAALAPGFAEPRDS